MNDNFAVFILTHGRHDNVATYNTLRRHGYTGRIFLIVDNEDSSIDAYKQKFNQQVIIFDKEKVARTVDSGDNFKKRGSPLYARNASFQIAKDLNIRYFVQLDDDYNGFIYRTDGKNQYATKSIKNLDAIFDALLSFLISTSAHTVAIAQGGDFIGGSNGHLATKPRLLRKAMNSFMCDAEKPFEFFGVMNDDVNTYIMHGMRGKLMFTVPFVSLSQGQTQANKGGITELYLEQGTYVKSFYSIMYAPAFVKIMQIGNKNMRLHHAIKWRNAVPKILSESLKKAG